MHDQQVGKHVTKPPVRITNSYMERKWALYLIFIPRRCHSFCSFNGFRQLGWNSGKVVFVCVTETHWGICCKRVNTGERFIAQINVVFLCQRFGAESNSLFYWLARLRKTPLMWLLSESKNTKAQLHITANRLLKGSIRVMLTFVQRTIGFPVLNVNQNGLL